MPAISWYPRHMNQARREIAAAMPRTDVVLEILDARLPWASANPVFEQLREGKPRLVLLNKEDLADAAATTAWVDHFRAAERTEALAIRATDAGRVRHALKRARALAGREPQPGRPIRILVLGIPNVGKSTLLNSFLGRKVARVGDEPAITKGQQVVEPEPGLRLVDTPGLLWPKLDEEVRAWRLAASGAIKDAEVDEVEVAVFVLDFLLQAYPDLLRARYHPDPWPKDGREALLEIGRRRGCLVKGGEIDLHKAARIVLPELRAGKIGRITLERPPSG